MILVYSRVDRKLPSKQVSSKSFYYLIYIIYYVTCIFACLTVGRIPNASCDRGGNIRVKFYTIKLPRFLGGFVRADLKGI